MTINGLPDDALLEIFGFYMAHPLPPPSHEEDAWHTPVHVCRRWRCVVFGSPRRLDLRLLCINRRLLKTLDIWPELPIIMHVDDENFYQLPSITNVISVLKRQDRLVKIFMARIPNWFLKEVATTSGPFPALIELDLSLALFENYPQILPDSFLGGSVPRLRSFSLWRIPFPALGKLLLSTCDLVTLSLSFTADSEYLSPEAMVDILSTLTMLMSLDLFVDTPQFRTRRARRRPPALTRVVLPALTNFEFDGNGVYLDDIISRFDAPLDCIAMTFSEDESSDIPLLCDFIGHTKIPNAPYRADISDHNGSAKILLFQRKGDVDVKMLNLEFKCPVDGIDTHLSSLEKACSSLSSLLPSLEHLSIYQHEVGYWPPLQWQLNLENSTWMEILRAFTSVKDLILDEPAGLSVASALQKPAGEQVTEILPALQTIFLEGLQSSSPVPEGIPKFVAARELSGLPVVVHHRETNQ
jgi:hypothetical protein